MGQGWEKIYTFNMIAMMDPGNFVPGSLLAGLDTSMRYLAYGALFIAFAIKVPIFPFHTWLPDAHVEAPTPISVILAGVLLKMGTYGLLRISFPIFPDAMRHFAWELALLGVISMVYGALVAMAQTDFKKLIAYSSVSHMGIVVLGMSSMNTQGLTGAVFQMFNHGTITAMLFLIVGVIYDRAHTRGLNEFGGLMNQMPRYAGAMTVAFFAALGLPGLSGFISEMLLGAFQTFRTLTIIGAATIVLTAAYMLWVLQRVFLGPLPEKWKDLTDMNGRETFMLATLGVIVVFFGIYPAPILNLMNSSLNTLAALLQHGAPAAMTGDAHERPHAERPFPVRARDGDHPDADRRDSGRPDIPPEAHSGFRNRARGLHRHGSPPAEAGGGQRIDIQRHGGGGFLCGLFQDHRHPGGDTRRRLFHGIRGAQFARTEARGVLRAPLRRRSRDDADGGGEQSADDVYRHRALLAQLLPPERVHPGGA
jgi:hypothetical protein